MKSLIIFVSIILSINMTFGRVKSIKVLKKYFTNGYFILDSATGDLNQDGYKDLVVALANKNENGIDDVDRPLLFFLGNSKGAFVLLTNNKNVILCKGCGGVLGDPYKSIRIKNCFLIVKHYGGDWERWFSTTVFKYEKKSKKIKLFNDFDIIYDNSESKPPVKKFYSKKFYNKLELKDYSSDNR